MHGEPTQPAAPVPVYEELVSHEGKHIELKENVACIWTSLTLLYTAAILHAV